MLVYNVLQIWLVYLLIKKTKKMNTEILKVLKDLRSDLFYQIESKFGAEKASKYPSIVDADSLINKLTICGVSNSSKTKANKKEPTTPYSEWYKMLKDI